MTPPEENCDNIGVDASPAGLKAEGDTPKLKTLTARSVKWNLIDKFSTQVLAAVTGIVLARILSEEDFGLVGAILVFQAFASLFVDSGFSFALIQRKAPTRLDYSTVLWFNMGMAVTVYMVLFFCAPLIADCFGGDRRLVPLSRVMFLSFILNASAIVQTNRLMKKMDVRMVAASNALGLIAAAIVGISLAVDGYGVWAIVWQSITLNAVKSLVLWFTSGWLPVLAFSWSALRGFFSVGSGMMVSSFLNVLFQNIYSFFIGNRAGLVPLGYYTQADKWSKMGITSVSQTITASFLPALSQVQDDPGRFSRVSSKMNRFTAYILFPSMGFLAVMAPPIFNCLFGTKWDSSIVLFQLLLLRGIFTVQTALYNNYLIAMARTRAVVAMEVLRDSAALLFLVATIPVITMTCGGDMMFGIKILLCGQLAASVITWCVMTAVVARVTGRHVTDLVTDNLPYLIETLVIGAVMWAEGLIVDNCWGLLALQAFTGVGMYVGFNAALGSAVQKDMLKFIFKKQ